MYPSTRTSLRAALGTVATLALAGVGMPAGQATSSGPQAQAHGRPATTSSLNVPALPAAARAAMAASGTRGPHVVAALTSRHTRHFEMLGVTWAEGTGAATTVRVRTWHRSAWSSWSTLHDDEDGPESARAGTEPLWVGAAEGVDVRVTVGAGTAPRALKVVLVDDGTDPPASNARVAPGSAARSSADGSPTYTPRPTLVTRAAWGARPNSGCDSPRYGSHTLGVIFHHTVGSNRYSKSQSRGIVRGIQAFHMNGRGWCDIAYNFLVDKYGQVIEGRSGGTLRQVRGAHAGNSTVNTYDMGVAMMGNLDTVRPSAAMKSATVRLIGWRLGTNYLPAKGTYAIAKHRLNRISGHRDVHNAGIHPSTATACPGKYGYAWLRAKGGLRDRVAAYIKDYRSPIKTKAAQLGYPKTGYVVTGEYPTEGGRKTRFAKGDMYSKGSLGAHLVSGTTAKEYAAWNLQHGQLGFPSGDLVVVVPGKQAYQRFAGGSIYRVPQTGGSNRAFGLTAGVDTEYQGLGGFESPLGAPTSRVTTANKVDTASFELGTISYDQTTKVATVTYF